MTTTQESQNLQQPRRRFRGIAAIVIYGLAAWIAVWGFRLPGWKTTVPLGIEGAATVPLFNLWTIGWNASRAQVWGTDYWQAPIFAPEEDTFALSEAQPLFLLIAPLTNATTPAVTYNLYLLVSLILNGIFARRLVRRTGAGPGAALVAGLLTVLLPYIHWSLGVLQLVPVWGLLWSLERMFAYAESPRLTSALLIGVAWFVSYVLCNYYGLFLALLTPPVLVVLLGRRLLQCSVVGHLAAGAFVAMLLASPILWKQWQVLNHAQYEREAEIVQQLSARPIHLLVPPNDRLPKLGHQYWKDDVSVMTWRLGVGSLWTLTALIGVVVGLTRSGRRRWTLAVMVLGLSAGFLACGLNSSIGGLRPYESLQEIVPGLKLIRSPNRFAVFVQLSLMLLAAEAISAICPLADHRSSDAHSEPPRGPALRRGGLTLLATGWVFLILYQVGPQPSELGDVPQTSDHAGWIDCIRRETNEADRIVCLPFSSGGMPGDYLQTTRWMYLGLAHKRPLVNGYSGYFPRSFRVLKGQLQSFPDAVSLRALAEAGVRFCVVQSPPDQPLPTSPPHPLLETVCSDSASRVTVYRLNPAEDGSASSQVAE